MVRSRARCEISELSEKRGGGGYPYFAYFAFFAVPKKENEVGKYLDIIRRVEAEGRQPTPNPESIPTPDNPYASILDPLRARCPVHVPPERWQQAVADSDAFLRRWGEQAHALGWTARDLWGLHTPPKKQHANLFEAIPLRRHRPALAAAWPRGRRTDRHHRSHPMAGGLDHDISQEQQACTWTAGRQPRRIRSIRVRDD